ncbi:MAG: hypothetical protein M1531_00350 [Chloroflexi bacterium]|nr:hypothetical protein [Chloroflexota bacterium]
MSKRSTVCLIVFLVVLVAGAAAYAAGNSLGLGPALAQGPDESPLLELAQRLLAPPLPGPFGQPQAIQLMPGQLPAGLPLDVPVPPGATTIGSAVHTTGDRTSSVDVLFDMPGDSASLLAFYQQELPARGWNPAPAATAAPHGFQSPQPVVNRSFCQSPTGPWLSVSIYPKVSGPNDVRLHLDPVNPGPCGQLGPLPSRLPPGADLVPPLYPPSGVPLQTFGSGIGPGRWGSDAIAETGQDVAALEAGFARQLQAAGWSRTAGRADGPLAWSTWTVPGDGGWQGFLYVLQEPGTNRRSMHVHVESATAPFGPTGPLPAPQAPPAPPTAPPPAPAMP